MSGTTKAIVSMCVLLLAALVVYYGMNPPDDLAARSLDLPTHRTATINTSVFGGDAYEKGKELGLLVAIADEPVEMPYSEIGKPAGFTSVTTEFEPQVVVTTKEQWVAKATIPEPVVETATFWLYTFLEDDTLTEIASRELGSYNRWREIASLNNISDPSRIMAGKVLKLPLPSGVVTPMPTAPEIVLSDNENVYTVSDGDTLSSIAEEFYGKANLFNMIAKANPTINPDRLKIGVKLIIPSR